VQNFRPRSKALRAAGGAAGEVAKGVRP
jgi:hypothetical protein